MNQRKWRNPYTPLSKKTGQSTAGSNAPASLAVTAKKTLPTLDLRSSVSKMRSNIKGISSTIRQMEETMDTLYGAMEIVDSIGNRASRGSTAPQGRSGRELPAPEPDDTDTPSESGSGGSNPLANIDMSQLLGLLQSPLVQSLLSQSTSSSAKRKKEG
ncbi:hypothetical protein [Brevibacillus migulae]|uniref:hypothetical protein n=1 Tax=Brevibacillus migulae TaxID=1644114 RepID=UPI00106F0860|nr:hypothetical protein [Brevibacillus migulae]